MVEEKRISQEIELQSYLNNLIIEEKKRWEILVVSDDKYFIHNNGFVMCFDS